MVEGDLMKVHKIWTGSDRVKQVKLLPLIEGIFPKEGGKTFLMWIGVWIWKAVSVSVVDI